MEVSFMLASSRSANMRALLADEKNEHTREMMHRLATLAREPARGFHRVDDFDISDGWGVAMGRSEYTLGSLLAADVSVDEDYEAPLTELLSGAVDFSHAIFYDNIWVRGIPYGRAGSSKWRNSAIIFHPTPSTEPQAGQIEHIMQFYCEPGVFLAIRSFTPVEATSDPYRRYGPAAGYLCSSSRGLHIVAVSELVSHCAVTKMGCGDIDGGEVFHILSLEKVGPPGPPYLCVSLNGRRCQQVTIVFSYIFVVQNFTWSHMV